MMRVMLQLDPSGIPCSHPPKEVGWGPPVTPHPCSPTADQVPLSSASGCCGSQAALACAAALGGHRDVRWANGAAAPCSEQPRRSTGNFPPAESLFQMVYSKDAAGQKCLFSILISEDEYLIIRK